MLRTLREQNEDFTRPFLRHRLLFLSRFWRLCGRRTRQDDPSKPDYINAKCDHNARGRYLTRVRGRLVPGEQVRVQRSVPTVLEADQRRLASGLTTLRKQGRNGASAPYRPTRKARNSV